MSKKTKSEKIIAGAMSACSLLGGGVAPMLMPMSTYAATTFKEGTRSYTLPELTNTQQQQLQSGIQILNRAFMNHQTTVSLPFEDIASFSKSQRLAIDAYMRRAALKQN